MSFRRKFTSVLVLAVTGVGAFSIFDDYLIFQQCSKSALETANTDVELKTILGESIERGPLYAATMGVDREGNSANCSFPVTGSLAKGNLHLRAVRCEETESASYVVCWPQASRNFVGSGGFARQVLNYHTSVCEKYKWLTPYFPGSSGGRWQVLVLEALVPTDKPPAHRRLSLIHRRPMVGDRGGGEPCGTPNTAGHQEV